jgi:DNA polymerase III delta subunit
MRRCDGQGTTVTDQVRVYVGDDATEVAGVREAFAATATIDARTELDRQLADLTTRTLVAAPRRVWLTNLDGLDPAQVDRLVALEGAPDLVIAGHATKLAPKVRARLGKRVVLVAAPRSRDAAAKKVRQLATQVYPELNPRAVARLAGLCGTDFLLARSTLLALRTLQMDDPTPRQLQVLTGERRESGPWLVSDALERGELAAALELLEQEEPVAVWWQLRNRLDQVSRCVADGVSGQAKIAAHLSISPFAARVVDRLAVRWGAQSAVALRDVYGLSPETLRGPAGRDRLALLLVRLDRQLN